MPQSDFDKIIEKYVEMSIAHPFRKGNSRATRIWLDLILKRNRGRVVDWSKVDKEDYLLAMERSPIRDIEIKHILKNALTDKINDHEVYMKVLIQVITMRVIRPLKQKIYSEECRNTQLILRNK